MEIITPKDYTGTLIELSQSRRGEFQDMKYLTESRTTLIYDMPLAEVVTDFFDQIKSLSAGYASMEYSITGVYQPLTVSTWRLSLIPFFNHSEYSCSCALCLKAPTLSLFPPSRSSLWSIIATGFSQI